MKEFFAGLNTRDRRLLVIGSIVVAILILYGLVWAPLSNKVARLQVTVTEQKQLESWMNQASQEVLRLRKMSAPTSGTQPRQSLLALTDQTAKQQGLAQSIKRVQPEGQDKVNIRMEAAAFDDMMAWLEKLQLQYRIRVTSITIDRQDRTGLVDVRVTLEGGQG